jgi:SAM-dependent methyltransferase
MMEYQWSATSTQEIEAFWEAPEEIASRKAIADAIGPIEGRLTEVGCGSGRQGILIPCDEYLGFDGSASMLSLARDRFGERKATFTTSPADCIPCQDRGGGTVLCAQVLRHNDDYLPILLELCRIATDRVIIVDRFDENIPRMGRCRGFGGEWPDNTWCSRIVMNSFPPGWSTLFHYVRDLWPIGIIEARRLFYFRWAEDPPTQIAAPRGDYDENPE